jgi:putative two-component system response regulator
VTPCQRALEGRIATVADVFDALTSDRVYRAALSVKAAAAMIAEERGGHFDPQLHDAFILALPEMEAVRTAYSD